MSATISLPSGFKITAAEPIDDRLILTKADMKAMPAARMPDYYFCFDGENHELYFYDESSSFDIETGYYHPYADYFDFVGAIQTCMADPTKAASFAASMANIFNSDQIQYNTTTNKLELKPDTWFLNCNYTTT